jgi:hypothetical protein
MLNRLLRNDSCESLFGNLLTRALMT